MSAAVDASLNEKKTACRRTCCDRSGVSISFFMSALGSGSVLSTDVAVDAGVEFSADVQPAQMSSDMSRLGKRFFIEMAFVALVFVMLAFVAVGQ